MSRQIPNQQSGAVNKLNDANNVSLVAWSHNYLDLDPGGELQALVELEQNVPVVAGVDTSLRAKVIDACGMTCVFCHNEGTPVAADARATELNVTHTAASSGRVSVFTDMNGVSFVPGIMQPGEKFGKTIGMLKDNLELDELHLTGGEPTLHGKLTQIILQASNLGYKVKMTSNGENGARTIPRLVEAGLTKVIFSIFGTTPQELASVQNDKYTDEKLAARKITALRRSMHAAIESGIDTSANIVVPDESHYSRLHRLLEEFEPELNVRFLNDLDGGSKSYAAVYKFLREIGALPVALKVEAGSSNAKAIYEMPGGRRVEYKHIRSVRLPKTCVPCQFNSDEMCKEGYYGVRLYVDDKGAYKVGVCIQRMDLTTEVNTFIEDGLAAEVVQLRHKERQQLGVV